MRDKGRRWERAPSEELRVGRRGSRAGRLSRRVMPSYQEQGGSVKEATGI